MLVTGASYAIGGKLAIGALCTPDATVAFIPSQEHVSIGIENGVYPAAGLPRRHLLPEKREYACKKIRKF
ncbi:hypothetical protein HOE425_330979 [Hoeflea sp. EC-HK425]|nr:hypothetical protein HOE425_330979 [Hoeflea sp. EC-HK425]